MRQRSPFLAAPFALLALGVGFAVAAPAGVKAKRAAPSQPIALIADRRVDEADIRRAAVVLDGDPLRKRQHAAWRKKLLDLCVDRELLALEAERQGLLADRDVKRAVERRSADILFAAIRERALIPEITPTASQIDTARAGGLYRRVKLGYILSVTDKKSTYEIYEAMKHGARFDSLAPLYSTHPSAARGGELGWRRVGELNPESQRSFATAKPGDILGPYANYQSHEFYRVEAIEDPDDAAIREAMLRERVAVLDPRYEIRLLQKHHFALNPDMVSEIIFASVTEKADSILASLDADGTRPKRGIKPRLGTIARVDGDSITYRDLSPDLMVRDSEGKSKIEDTRALLIVSTATLLPRLIEGDARERGLDRDPGVMRALRLVREEISTKAMVARAVPALDSSAVRAYYASHTSKYTRPSARRAFVAMFSAEDTARAARVHRDRKAFRDSILAIEGFKPMTSGAVNGLFPRFYGEISLFDTDTDPLSVSVRGLEEGEIAPLIQTPNGYAVAQALGREAARPYTFEEARASVAADAREDAENAWVMVKLERLRVATPARTVPARLDAIRLGMNSESGGTRR